MKNNKIFLVGGIIFASEIIWYLYKKVHNLWIKSTNTCKDLKTNIYESKQDISEVMFFTKESSFCRTHLTNKEICLKDTCSVQYLRKLENYINQAKESLDICMYMLTCQMLSNAIVNAHKRGVLVRIIMDRSMACNEAAQTALFYKNGVTIRLEYYVGLMHHKFAIVDNDILITGSTNWTMSAFFGNFDHIIVTNQHLLVKPFIDEFDRLWKTFPNSQENIECSAEFSVK